MVDQVQVGVIAAHAHKVDLGAVTDVSIERNDAVAKAGFEKIGISSVAVLKLDGEQDFHGVTRSPSVKIV
jgi:hypothetical protein